MATIDLGKIRFNWQGAYNNSTAYVINDVVSSGGNSYICKLASTGNAVSNGTYWDLMSSAGTNGSNGTDLASTLSAQGDIVVKGASALERLAKGTASQQLRMNSGATGLEYFTPASSGLDSFSAKGSSNQSLPYNTDTKLLFATEIYDTASKYDPSTSIWTPSAGKVLLHASIYMGWNTIPDGKGIGVGFHTSANVDLHQRNVSFYSLPNWQRFTQVTAIAEADGTNGFQVKANCGDTTTRNTQASYSFFSGVQLS